MYDMCLEKYFINRRKSLENYGLKLTYLLTYEFQLFLVYKSRSKKLKKKKKN